MKHIVYLGSSTNAAGETITPPTDLQQLAANNSCRMDLLISITALTGTSPTVTVKVQEQFSDLGFVTTAQSSALAATGTYAMMNGGQTGQTLPASYAYGFDLMGKGHDKQIVTTVGGTVSTITIKFWAILYDGSGS